MYSIFDMQKEKKLIVSSHPHENLFKVLLRALSDITCKGFQSLLTITAWAGPVTCNKYTFRFLVNLHC